MTFSIIQKSQLEGALRLDAEYYQPEYLAVSQKIKKSPFGANQISELLSRAVVTGSTPKKRVCKNDGTDIKFIKTDTLREGQIIFDDADCLPLQESRKNSEPKPGDIIVTIIGATYDIVGRVARVFPGDPKMNINQNVALLRPQDPSLSSYLSIFLQTKYGRDQLCQQSRQTEQVNLNCREVENVLVPLPEKDFIAEIDNLVLDSYNFIRQSKNLYSQAESLLLEKLGLAGEMFKDKLSYVVDFSNIKPANRIDADYFQPKYKGLISKIKNQNAKLLGDLVLMKKGVEVGSEVYQEEGKPFIRVSNLSKYGFEGQNQKYLNENLYHKLKENFEPKVGEILLTKDATPGIAYVLKESLEGVIAGGILRLEPNSRIDPEYLALVLNSIIGQTQIERDAGGSVILHWRPEQIKNCLVPILPKSIQQKIANLVRRSHTACRKAKELLEKAKKEVEEMIEKGNKRRING